MPELYRCVAELEKTVTTAALEPTTTANP